MVNMVNPEPIEVRERPMTEEEFNRKGLFGGVVPVGYMNIMMHKLF